MKKLLTYFLYLAAFMPLLAAHSLLYPYVSGKNIFLRAIVAVCFGIFFILVVRDHAYRAAIAEKLRRLRTRPLFLGVCMFVFLALVSTVFAVNRYRAFFGDIERGEGFINIFFLCGFFLVALLVFERKEWLTFFKLSVIGGLILCVAILGDLAQGIKRPAPLVGNPIFLAAYLLFGIFSAWQIRSSRSVSDIWRKSALVAIVLFFMGIAVTETRGMFVGILAGAVAVLFHYIARTKGAGTSRARALVFGTIFLFILLGGVFVITNDSAFWQHIPLLRRVAGPLLEDATLQTRLISIGVSLRAMNPAQHGMQKFLIGWGPENFNLAYNANYNPAYFRYEQGWFDRAHNKLMDVLVMQGVVGLIAYLALWAALWKEAFGFRAKSDGDGDTAHFSAAVFFSVTFFVQNLFSFDSIVTYVPFFSFIAFVLYRGALDEMHGFQKSPRSAPAPVRAGLACMTGVLGLAYAAGAIVWTGIPFSQVHSYVQNGGKDDRAFAPFTYAQDAIRMHYLQTVAAGQESGAEKLGELRRAIAYMEEIAGKEPHDSRTHMAIGRAYERLGELGDGSAFAAAEAHYQKAFDLSPNRQDVLNALAGIFLKKGDPELAIRTLKEAIASEEHAAVTHAYLGDLYVRMGAAFYDRAFDEMRQAYELRSWGYANSEIMVGPFYVLLQHYYGQENRERSVYIAEAMQKLVPEKSADLEGILSSIRQNEWNYSFQ